MITPPRTGAVCQVETRAAWHAI